MKAQSVSMKKRVNYGKISADDPQFSQQLMNMDASKVKKSVINTSFQKQKQSTQQSQSPNTSFTQSLSGAMISPSPKGQANNLFTSVSHNNEMNMINDQSNDRSFASEFGQTIHNEGKGIYVEIEKRNQNSKTNHLPVSEQIIDNEQIYQKTIVFVEQRSSRKVDNSVLQKITPKKNMKSNTAPPLPYENTTPVRLQKQLFSSVTETAESLQIKQDDILQETDDMMKLLEDLMEQDVKPIAQDSNKSQFKIRGLYSHEQELNAILNDISSAKNLIKQTQQKMLNATQDNDAYQQEIIDHLTTDDSQYRIDDQSYTNSELLLNDLIERVSHQQVWVDRSSLEDFDQFKQFQDEHKQQMQQYVSEEFDLDKQIVELQKKLKLEQVKSFEIQKYQVKQQIQIQELQNEIQFTKEEMQSQSALYEKYNQYLKETARDNLKTSRVLEEKIQNFNREKQTYELQLKERLNENEQCVVDRIKGRQEDICLQIVTEIEELAQKRADGSYPELDLNMVRQNNESDYIEELDRINTVEVELNDKQRKIVDIDDRLISTVKVIESYEIQSQFDALLNDLNVIFTLESQICDESSRKILTDLSSLKLVVSDQTELKQDIKSQVSKLDLNNELLQTAIYEYKESIDAQQDDLSRDLSLTQMKGQLEDQQNQKLEQIQTLEAKINNKKHELKQMEQLQRKKDDTIEELEVMAGKDKKVIKEVLIDKVRENKVDEIMDELMNMCKVPIRKINENYFQFGSKKIYVKYDPESSEVMVRSKGGRYIEVKHYIRENEDIEYDMILRGDTRYTTVGQQQEVQHHTINL